jgi:hypothetical protein
MSLAIVTAACTRKRLLSCRHDMFSNNAFSIVEFDCYLRERTVPIQAGIKLSFSEFILIFDLVFGFYCSGQKSRQNTEIKSY